MDEAEFRRLLDLFPVVRPRDYCVQIDSGQSTSRLAKDEEVQIDSGQSTSHLAKDEEQVKEWQAAWDEEDKKQMDNQGANLHEAFWERLKLAAGKKVGAAEAEKFCQAFQKIHKKLVYEGLSLDAARRYINSSEHSEK